MGDTIGDELEALRRERPKPDTGMADCLVDIIEAILRGDGQPMPVPEAVDAYVAALNAHIDRRVGRYVRDAEIIG